MFDKTFDLKTLNGTNGFVISDPSRANHNFAFGVSNAGDINGDEIADFIINVPNLPVNNGAKGGSYIVFGNSNGFPANFDVSALNGRNGFAVVGLNQGDHLGIINFPLMGDMNGDKKIDVVLGAQFYNKARGVAYVIFGQNIFPAVFDLRSLNGTNGFVIPGININDRLGSSICLAGDINHDGKDDLVVGAYCSHDGLCQGKGFAHVIFGQTSFPPIFDVNTLNGTNGFTVPGINMDDHLGASCGMGDVNGDKRDDLVLGGFGVESAKGIGVAYVIYGHEGKFPQVWDLKQLNGTNGFKIPAINVGDFFSMWLSVVDDINGDAIKDMVFGAPLANANKGAVYIVFGKSGNFPSIFDLKTLDGTNGFTVTGIDSGGRLCVPSGLKDINGDGRNDLALGAAGYLGDGTEKICTNVVKTRTFVIFGQKNYSAAFDLNSLNGTNGFQVPALNFGDCVGYSIGIGGDINNDGLPDIALGAPGANNTQGVSYIIYGKNPLRLLNNQLFVTQNNSVVLNTTNFKAVDLNKDATQNLLFNIFELKGGKFEFVYQVGSITNFTQDDIIKDQVRFVQDASSSVSYWVSVSNGYVHTSPSSANVTLKFIPPILVNNKITIKQGKTTILTHENLSATDLNFPVGTLIFSVSHVEGGQFERISKPGLSITTFTQQEVIDKQIQFAQDNSIGAGYEVVATDGNNLSTAPSKANVTFAARPILWNNQLFVKQGGSVVLNKSYINATDDVTPDSRLMIAVTNVKHGQFEYNNQPDVAIDHFTQENITQSVIRFKTDGGYEKPSYDLTVKDDSDLTDGPKAADVTFHDKPRLVNNQLTIRNAQTVTLSRSDLSATENYTPEEDLEFEASNIQHGAFQWKNHSNSAKPSLAVTKFFQKNITDRQVQFAHDGSGIKPSYAIRVSDGELTNGSPENATINFQDSTPIDKGLIIGVGVAGAAALGIGATLAYRYYKKPPVIITAPTKKESEVDQLINDEQQTNRHCQLF